MNPSAAPLTSNYARDTIHNPNPSCIESVVFALRFEMESCYSPLFMGRKRTFCKLQQARFHRSRSLSDGELRSTPADAITERRAVPRTFTS